MIARAGVNFPHLGLLFWLFERDFVLTNEVIQKYRVIALSLALIVHIYLFFLQGWVKGKNSLSCQLRMFCHIV